MFKKIITQFFIVLFLFLTISKTCEAQQKVNLYLFWAHGCPHCAKEKIFLEKLPKQYPQLVIKDYEITSSQENLQLLKRVGKELSVDVSGVPFTVVGRSYIIGYDNEVTTGKEIKRMINDASAEGCEDFIGKLCNQQDTLQKASKTSKIPEFVKIPLIGNINISQLSLPVITILIGALDGFNPCAMWVLIFLITMLLGMKDRRRMWILGTVFIAASAFVYFLFMSAWLNFILFVGYVALIRLIIGIIALVAGGYNLKEYLTNKDASCKVTKGKKRQNIFNKIKQITFEKKFLVALVGIILLAFAVNLVELICSAGFPAVYTQILVLNQLPVWQYYLYLLLYIFVFMLDDLIVFIVSMKALEVAGVTTKYTRISYLIGGILMLAIGILLILKPEVLMFG